MAIPINFKFSPQAAPATPTNPFTPLAAGGQAPALPQDGYTPNFPSVIGGLTNFNDAAAAQQAELQARARSKLGFTGPGLDRAGSLVVVDNFTPTMTMGPFGPGGPAETPHGHMVAASARGQGFQGNLIASEYQPTDGQLRSELRNRMNQAGLPAQEFKQALSQRVRQNSIGLLESMNRRLEGLQEAGLRNSAVNLSFGADQASEVLSLYGEVRQAFSPGPFQQFSAPLLDNYCRAFGLDKPKLMSEDPAVSGPERGKLQQALIDQVRGASEGDPAISAARARYDQAVNQLESGHNSVVVSASNGGKVLEILAADAPGSAPLKTGPSFYDNVLANSQTTVVGATTGRGADEKVAGYSSDYKEVDVYANGTAPLGSFPGLPDAQGTSFASPRVAAVMAQLHELYPEKTSAQIEAMLKEQLSHQLLSYDGRPQLPVLNAGPEGAATFLSPYM